MLSIVFSCLQECWLLGPQFLPFIFLQNMLFIERSLVLVLILAVLSSMYKE